MVDKGEPEGDERPGFDDQVLLDLDLALGEELVVVVVVSVVVILEVSIVIG